MSSCQGADAGDAGGCQSVPPACAVLRESVDARSARSTGVTRRMITAGSIVSGYGVGVGVLLRTDKGTTDFGC
jgi:hypothetical protein